MITTASISESDFEITCWEEDVGVWVGNKTVEVGCQRFRLWVRQAGLPIVLGDFSSAQEAKNARTNVILWLRDIGVEMHP